jgi:hypothetical protein
VWEEGVVLEDDADRALSSGNQRSVAVIHDLTVDPDGA